MRPTSQYEHSWQLKFPVLGAQLLVLAVLMLALSACQMASLAPTSTPAPTEIPPTPTHTLADQHPKNWAAWQSGAHSAGYDLGKGPNTYCARCHSPANWDPKATIDLPPNCVSCKFQSDAAPRVAKGNPLILEADWKGIGCSTCHRVENGNILPGLAWKNPTSGYQETVENSKILCEKCHTDTPTLRYKIDMGSQNHTSLLCTDCHDPHNLQASCSRAGCHNVTTAAAPHPTMNSSVSCLQAGCHTAKDFTSTTSTVRDQKDGVWNHQSGRHTAVSCAACHDATGLDVGILAGKDIWVTFRTVNLLGKSSQEAYPSHNLQKSVNCARCHFPGNSWGLAESVKWSPTP